MNSGAVLSAASFGSSGKVDNALRFGSTEAIITSFSDLTLAGPLSGTGGLTKSGPATLILAGTNAITGPITINQGTLQVPDLAHLGTETSAIVLNDAALRINASAGSTVTLSRAISLNGVRGTLDSGAGSLRVDGLISGQGGINVVGDVILNAINTYTGITEISSRLTIGSDAVLGASPSLFLHGKLALNGPWITERSVQVGSSAIIDTGNSNTELRGSLSGAEALEKRGGGRLTIHEAGNFFGTLNVTEGTLRINSIVHPHEVYAGPLGTLTGNGTILTSVGIQGVLAPGDGIGTLSTGSLSFLNSVGLPTLAMELGSASDFDQVHVSGSVSLAGSVALQLTIAPGFDPAPYIDSFPVLLNDGIDAITLNNSARFTIDGGRLNEGDRFVVDGREFSLSYIGGTGNDVVLYSVPEPTHATLMLFGSLSLSLLRPRRLRKIHG